MNDKIRIRKLEKKVEALERKLEELLSQRPYMPLPPVAPMPTYPIVPNIWGNRCSVCNMEFVGAMGYVCGRSDCPSNVTC